MNEFYQGLIAGLGMLGGICAFNYWMFLLLKESLHKDLSTLGSDVHSLINDMREERKSKDALYKFVLDNYNKDTR